MRVNSRDHFVVEMVGANVTTGITVVVRAGRLAVAFVGLADALAAAAERVVLAVTVVGGIDAVGVVAGIGIREFGGT
jgi:hypothetical protein